MTTPGILLLCVFGLTLVAYFVLNWAIRQAEKAWSFYDAYLR